MTALRDDLEAWLAHRPVAARNGGPLYRTRRWLRRHAVAASLGGLLILSLAVGSVISLLQAQAARDEAARANAIRDLLVGVFTAASPVAEDGDDPRASMLLQRGAERVTRELADRPHLLSELLQVIGYTQYERGLVQDAAGTLDQALSLFDTQGPSISRVRALADRGMVHYEQGDTARAIEALQRAAAMAEAEDYPVSLRLLIAGRLADMRVVNGEPELALEVIDPWLDQRGAHLELADRAYALRVKGAAEQLSGRPEAAIGWLRDALAAQERLDPDNVFMAQILNELGIALNDLGRTEEALATFRRAYQQKLRIYGEMHPQTLTGLGNLAALSLSSGRIEEAEQSFRRVLSLQLQLHEGRPHPKLVHARGMLAWTVYQRGDVAEAHSHVSEAIRLARALEAPPPSARWVEPFAGLVALQLGRPGGATQLGAYGADCHELDAASAMSLRLCLARALVSAGTGACSSELPPRASAETLAALPEDWRAVHEAIAARCDDRPLSSAALPSWAARILARSDQPAATTTALDGGG